MVSYDEYDSYPNYFYGTAEPMEWDAKYTCPLCGKTLLFKSNDIQLPKDVVCFYCGNVEYLETLD